MKSQRKNQISFSSCLSPSPSFPQADTGFFQKDWPLPSKLSLPFVLFAGGSGLFLSIKKRVGPKGHGRAWWKSNRLFYFPFPFLCHFSFYFSLGKKRKGKEKEKGKKSRWKICTSTTAFGWPVWKTKSRRIGILLCDATLLFFGNFFWKSSGHKKNFILIRCDLSFS